VKGALEEQYVANMVITRSEYNLSQWTARFEVKYEADGIGYPNHRPRNVYKLCLGYFDSTASSPLSIDPSQFTSTDQRSAYYNLHAEQALYDSLQSGGDGGGNILPLQPARFVKPQAGGWGGRPPTPWTFYTFTGWKIERVLLPSGELGKVEGKLSPWRRSGICEALPPSLLETSERED